MITLTDPNEESRREPRVDKGKGRALDSLRSEPVRALKRKRSVEPDNASGPSKKSFLVPEDEEVGGQGDEVEDREEEVEWEEEEDNGDDEDGSYTDTPSSARKHVKRRRVVKYKRECLTCGECNKTFTAKNSLERHAPTHVKDKVLFVCAGEQGM